MANDHQRAAEVWVWKGVRALALQQLSTAQGAGRRLRDRSDVSALHDFRVALRRLRCTLEGYWPYVRGHLRRKHLRKLRALQRATNAAREAQTYLDLLQAHPDWHAGELTRTLRRRAARDVGLERHFSRLAALVEARLREDEPALTFRVASEAIIRRAAGVLGHRLAALHAPHQTKVAHRARIAGKRVRYLIEPFMRGPTAGRLLSRLRRLQDQLGDLHDAQSLREVVDKDPREPFRLPEDRVRLSTQLEREIKRRFEHLRGSFLGPRIPGLVAALRTFALNVGAGRGPASRNPRRRTASSP